MPISPCASPRQFRDATQADTENRLVLYQDFLNSDSKTPAPEYAEFSASRAYPPKSNARLTLATANKPPERCDRTLVRPQQMSRGKAKLPHTPNRRALQILETAFTRNTPSSSSGLNAPDAELHAHEPISTRPYPPPVPGLLHLPRSDIPSRSHPTTVNLLSADGSGYKRPSDPHNSRQRPRPIVQKPLGFSLNPSLLASAETSYETEAGFKPERNSNGEQKPTSKMEPWPIPNRQPSLIPTRGPAPKVDRTAPILTFVPPFNSPGTHNYGTGFSAARRQLNQFPPPTAQPPPTIPSHYTPAIPNPTAPGHSSRYGYKARRDYDKPAPTSPVSPRVGAKTGRRAEMNTLAAGARADRAAPRADHDPGSIRRPAIEGLTAPSAVRNEQEIIINRPRGAYQRPRHC